MKQDKREDNKRKEKSTIDAFSFVVNDNTDTEIDVSHSYHRHFIVVCLLCDTQHDELVFEYTAVRGTVLFKKLPLVYVL